MSKVIHIAPYEISMINKKPDLGCYVIRNKSREHTQQDAWGVHYMWDGWNIAEHNDFDITVTYIFLFLSQQQQQQILGKMYDTC